MVVGDGLTWSGPPLAIEVTKIMSSCSGLDPREDGRALGRSPYRMTRPLHCVLACKKCFKPWSIVGVDDWPPVQ